MVRSISGMILRYSYILTRPKFAHHDPESRHRDVGTALIDEALPDPRCTASLLLWNREVLG